MGRLAGGASSSSPTTNPFGVTSVVGTLIGASWGSNRTCAALKQPKTPPASQRFSANSTDANFNAFAKDANAHHFAVSRDILAPGYPRNTHTVADSVMF